MSENCNSCEADIDEGEAWVCENCEEAFCIFCIDTESRLCADCEIEIKALHKGEAT